MIKKNLKKSHQEGWESSFQDYNKSKLSVESLGGKDFRRQLRRYSSKNSYILDFGCGKGDKTANLFNLGYKNIFGTDPSENLMNYSKSEVNLKPMNNNIIPFSDNYFDLVFCSGVLHHIPWKELENSLKEIKRVLKNNGHFIYVEPRNSIFRKIGHLIVLSPLGKLNKNISTLASCLREEWPTYKPWLTREEKEFSSIYSKFGFECIESTYKMFTKIGVLKISKTKEIA